MVNADKDMKELLARIAGALERLAPPLPEPPDLEAADAFIWAAESGSGCVPVADRQPHTPGSLLQGVDLQIDILLGNTRRFTDGLPANNALLWGARGMGKSSLVKAVHAEINAQAGRGRESRNADSGGDPSRRYRVAPPPAVAAAPDRSGAASCSATTSPSINEDTSYKSLKAVLEGGIEGRPDNVLFYATSNRRHLMPRDMIENERSSAIIPGEAVEEKVSLSDRFGLWLGFHACSQETYLAMIGAYVAAHGLEIDPEQLDAEAREWAITRGARSGRVAWQFIQDLAGRLGKRLDDFGLSPETPCRHREPKA